MVSAAPKLKSLVAGLAAAGLLLSLAGCAPASTGKDAEETAKTVTLLVHDSFPNKEFAKAASKATGYKVKVVAAGDGGELTNKLVLTAGAPVADAFFGVDNTFASRLVDKDVLEPYTPQTGELAAGLAAVQDEKSGENLLTPVDHGAVCLNIDPAWFTEHSIPAPQTYEDLTKPEYKGLAALLDPTASSTGVAFLAGTVKHFGEHGYLDYWKKLQANEQVIRQGWSQAYYEDFTQGGENGKRPIVLSYASSPFFTVNEEGTATSTKALLDTCTSQVEYAGILRGAANEKGARAVLDYLLSKEFQKSIPDSMYMEPSLAGVQLPELWQQFALSPQPAQLQDLPPAQIGKNREGWLRSLGEALSL